MPPIVSSRGTSGIRKLNSVSLGRSIPLNNVSLTTSVSSPIALPTTCDISAYILGMRDVVEFVPSEMESSSETRIQEIQEIQATEETQGGDEVRESQDPSIPRDCSRDDVSLNRRRNRRPKPLDKKSLKRKWTRTAFILAVSPSTPKSPAIVHLVTLTTPVRETNQALEYIEQRQSIFVDAQATPSDRLQPIDIVDSHEDSEVSQMQDVTPQKNGPYPAFTIQTSMVDPEIGLIFEKSLDINSFLPYIDLHGEYEAITQKKQRLSPVEFDNHHAQDFVVEIRDLPEETALRQAKASKFTHYTNSVIRSNIHTSPSCEHLVSEATSLRTVSSAIDRLMSDKLLEKSKRIRRGSLKDSQSLSQSSKHVPGHAEISPDNGSSQTLPDSGEKQKQKQKADHVDRLLVASSLKTFSSKDTESPITPKGSVSENSASDPLERTCASPESLTRDEDLPDTPISITADEPEKESRECGASKAAQSYLEAIQQPNGCPFNRCAWSKVKFPNRQSFDEHMESAHNNHKHKCQLCSLDFSRNDGLLRHIRIFHKEDVSCVPDIINEGIQRWTAYRDLETDKRTDRIIEAIKTARDGISDFQDDNELLDKAEVVLDKKREAEIDIGIHVEMKKRAINPTFKRQIFAELLPSFCEPSYQVITSKKIRRRYCKYQGTTRLQAPVIAAEELSAYFWDQCGSPSTSTQMSEDAQWDDSAPQAVDLELSAPN